MTARHSYGANVAITTVTAILACFAAGTTPARADLNQGLIAHWPLSEGQGTWTEDVAGNHDGTIYGGPPWVAGVTGSPSDYALDFDGSNDYVNVGQFTQFGGTQHFSLCAWINRTTVSGPEPYILNNMYSSSRGIGLYSYGNMTAVTAGGINGTIYQATVRDFEDIADGQWHLIVGTYDGSALQLYIDGEWRGSNSDFSYYTASTQNMNIGRMEQGARYYFDGKIDEARIYNRALSADEVQDLPEPGTLALVMLGGLAVLRRRR
ncbi:MAG: PEP-CTERM sorting domain-containing protein [Planctomycetes bacterium]|nr:PEP-CTERM sorting domain-containing protein [Planctomycetota bacterium]